MTLPRVLADLHGAAESVWQAVATRLPGFAVEVLPTIDSTNSELMRRAHTGVADPVLLVAAEQTAGRGRRGRGWVSEPGASLTFSLGLPLNPADWSGLSLAVGVSLAESLDPAVQLKWPNDLWWEDRKLGGILVETANVGSQRYAIIGVGLNVVAPATVNPAAGTDGVLPVAPAGLSDLPSASLATAGACLSRVIPSLVEDMFDFERDGFGTFLSRFQARDALRGRPVRLSDGQTGIADGLRPDGALWISQSQGRLAVIQHEVSVRLC